ncbi:MAG: transcriptional repressor [Eubacterium sp.]|nr:transcriptional repressor [Eubacterium sp.]
MQTKQKEIILKELKNRGFRITKQRKMLLEVILDNECSSCKEIFVEASRKDNKIGTATVYRMVNLLEDIGAIDRRNMYKISYPENCSLEEACVVELDNNKTCSLSAKEWNRVLQAGLNACGYLEGASVCGVTLRPCACEVAMRHKQQKGA